MLQSQSISTISILAITFFIWFSFPQKNELKAKRNGDHVYNAFQGFYESWSRFNQLLSKGLLIINQNLRASCKVKSNTKLTVL